MLKKVSLLFFILGLAGCSTVSMPPPSASIDTLKVLREANIVTLSVRDFSSESKIEPSLGGLRGVILRSESGSFSHHLELVVITELSAAGLYSEHSEFSLNAKLLENKVDAAISLGRAELAAKFTVTQEEKSIFEKELSVQSEWDSSFIGDIAVPEAIRQYTALYKDLVKKLFEDVDFRKALSKQ